MDSSSPTTEMASETKTDKKGRWRSKSHSFSQTSATATILLVFLACVAWLYVAGRLWQDADSRTLLMNLMQKKLAQNPKVLSVDDKLHIFGCKDLQKKIVEVEMDLTLAKSQGYFQNQRKQNHSKKLLAVIGVYTGFGSRLNRNTFRGSWMPRGEKLKKLEEEGVVIRFVIGRSPNRGDSLDRNIDEENQKTKDFLIIEDHEEDEEEELPQKAKFFFTTAALNWDAEFYVKVDDKINLDLDGLIALLKKHRGQESAYIGCMQSGKAVVESGLLYDMPDLWKFGDKKTYFRHADESLIILSKRLAHYIFVNSASLKAYENDGISIGSWMIGLQTTYIDDRRLCCRSLTQDKVCSRRLLEDHDYSFFPLEKISSFPGVIFEF